MNFFISCSDAKGISDATFMLTTSIWIENDDTFRANIQFFKESAYYVTTIIKVSLERRFF